MTTVACPFENAGEAIRLGDSKESIGDNTSSVGNTALITLNSWRDADAIDFDNDGTDDVTQDGGADPYDLDDCVTITLIDTGTDRIFYEHTVLGRPDS